MSFIIKKEEGGETLLEMAKKFGTIVQTSKGDYYMIPYWFCEEKNGDIDMLSLRDIEKAAALIEEIKDLRNGW